MCILWDLNPRVRIHSNLSRAPQTARAKMLMPSTTQLCIIYSHILNHNQSYNNLSHINQNYLYPYSILYRYTSTFLSDSLIALTQYMDIIHSIHIIQHKLTIQEYTREEGMGRAHHFHISRGFMSCGRITTLAI